MGIKIKAPKAKKAEGVVSMNKATFNAYMFHLFFGAGLACLMPFLPLYFRFLGLTAAQVGMVFGAKAVINMMWAPCWTRCSTRFRKKRFVMIFSVFILLGTYALMVIIPPANRELSNIRFCPSEFGSLQNLSQELDSISKNVSSGNNRDVELASKDIQSQSTGEHPLETTLNDPESTTTSILEDLEAAKKNSVNLDDEDIAYLLKNYGINIDEMSDDQIRDFIESIDGILSSGTERKKRDTWHDQMPPYRSRPSNMRQRSKSHKGSFNDEEEFADEDDRRADKKPPRPTTTTSTTTSTTTTTTTSTTTTPSTATPSTTTPSTTPSTTSSTTSSSTTSSTTTSTTPSTTIPSQASIPSTPPSTTTLPTHSTSPGDLRPPTTANTTFGSLFNSISQEKIYDSFANIMNRIHELPGQLNTVINEKVFAAVLGLIIIGEMFSAPAEKLADDIWFEFLDSTDVLEKYGSHKMWAALGMALVPPALTVAVDRTPCLLAKINHHDVHHLLLHFFAFYGFILLAFFFTICYPIYATIDGKKVLQRRGRFCRGLSMLFNDVHASFFTLSVLIMGFLQGATNTFLFWFLQDKGAPELIMGLCLTAAFAGEFLMLGIGRWLVSKIGFALCVFFGLLVLCGRYVFYSFAWDPWYIIAVEGFHCLSVTLIWSAVRTYPDFRLNSLVMDRSANSVMTSFYHGLGLAPGCFVAGYIYDWIGATILFQAAAVVAGAWALLFGIVYRCSKKPQKVRYAKLLQDEEEVVSDGSMEYDDDWLEVAMKHQK